MLFDDGLELLSEPECHDLLEQAEVGRVGMTLGALPVILPVNYGLLGNDVVFRTGAGTKLRAAVDHAVIAFEVDAYDVQRRTGWSVLLVGQAHEVVDPAELAQVRSLGIRPFADDGDRDHYVRLHPEFMSGRRISH